MNYSVREIFRQLLDVDPQAEAVEYEGRWWTWQELGEVARGLVDLLDQAGVETDTPIAWVARNHPALIGAAMGIVGWGRMLAPLNPHQPAVSQADDLEQLNMAVVVAVGQDWTDELKAAASRVGALGLELRIGEANPVRLVPGLESVRMGAHRQNEGGYVIERVTSGTTGTPKRIPATEDVLTKALKMGARSEKASKAQAELTLKKSPAILYNPFAHSGGLFGMLLNIGQGRRIVLFERFDVAGWAAAVRKYQVKAASLVPTMIKMVLDSDLPADALRSVLAVRAGTAPLDPELKKAFEERFNVPVLIEYGASEFVGGVAGWSLADHKAHSASKKGAVGRPRPDVQLRAIDTEGKELPTGEIGILEILCPRFGPDWISTTDLASLDDDGFLYIHGRADEAIIRGGFKVLPEQVAEVLRMYAGVSDAAVLGIKDARLGHVPLAVIEHKPDVNLSAEDIKSFSREQMPAYNVPVAFEFVHELPRTVSMKVERPRLREMFSDKYEF